MEPVEGKVRYIIETVVEHMHERELGWYVHFEGSHESLFLGPDHPDLAPGDKVRITICRA